jgi:aerobic-type carbon monoxide dehydrogenase small subunit (CoxS/CutS family)
MEKTISFTVNGHRQTVTTDPDRPLLDVLREDLGLTGTKCGCGEGRCGSCNVLIGGRSTSTCILPVAEADGQTIVTIEGLANGETLHPVQEAFLAEGAMQCGYCTPGMIMATVGLLGEIPNPTETEILTRMEGHVCRCCGYTKILKAIGRAAAHARKQ